MNQSDKRVNYNRAASSHRVRARLAPVSLSLCSAALLFSSVNQRPQFHGAPPGMSLPQDRTVPLENIEYAHLTCGNASLVRAGLRAKALHRSLWKCNAETVDPGEGSRSAAKRREIHNFTHSIFHFSNGKFGGGGANSVRPSALETAARDLPAAVRGNVDRRLCDLKK